MESTTLASDPYRACDKQHLRLSSMSRTGNCWDNAVAESFIATLEYEFRTAHRFASHGAAPRAHSEFIDGWYKTERLHSAPIVGLGCEELEQMPR